MYLCMDLKSFYASVECVDRGLNPLTTNLVVADPSRTEKTICLAVSPSLKAYGIPGRARLFEVIEQVRRANAKRRSLAPGGRFTGSSAQADELAKHPEYQIDYLIAPPRMTHYMKVSIQIYDIYLKYAAPEDIHVYSIDEVFIDLTKYLPAAGCTAREYAKRIMQEIFAKTKITATAGIGTNLYLAKIAMDIEAKHIQPDEDGTRIAELDEISYRKKLWTHQPITDFWRVGRGYAAKLKEHGMLTMGDVARCSIGKPGDYHNEELLYRLFGIHAELLIDHAWGYEPCRMEHIKAYKPENNSVGSGQVLHCPYTAQKTRLVVKEMADQLSLQLVDQGLVTDQMVLTVGYDIENLTDPKRSGFYRGEVMKDRYGRSIPKHAHGTENLGCFTSSTRQILDAVLALYDRIIDEKLLIRRVYLTANHVMPETEVKREPVAEQLDLFTDYAALEQKRKKEQQELEREKRLQHAMLDIKKKFGKNAILKGMNLCEGATAKERNDQIGGHKA